MRRLRTTTKEKMLKVVLWLGAAVDLGYFTASHWFFHRWFFHTLGIRGPDLESPFVISQLQLIGALVMGYALLNVVIARDPVRYREIMKIVLLVGCVCTFIFIGNVVAGTLPPLFLTTAALLCLQIVPVAWLFPWDTKERAPAQ